MTSKFLLSLILAWFGSAALAAGNTLFDDVEPNLNANVPIPVNAPEETTDAFVLPSSTWTQTSIASRNTQLALGQSNSGLWDMIDSNRTGLDANRYLFMPFESNSAGAQRIDTWTGTTTTIVDAVTQNWASGDASRWTPWGGWLTGEENWSSGNTGRLFEVTNPITASGPADVIFVQRNNVLPHVSHEGLVFDRHNNLYFVDEDDNGSIYKFVSANPNADNGDDFFSAGISYALKVGDGNNVSIVGSFSWEPLDVGNVDGREAADDVFATGFSRPEDLEIKDLGGGLEYVFFAATGTHEVWTINLKTNSVYRFVTRETIDIATGLAVGTAFSNPDNLAIDADGNIYIVEDQRTPNADIWRAIDEDNNGIAEYVTRWTALRVTGAEPTGLFFSRADPNVAYINIQHPSSGNDQTYRITATAAPVPLAPAAVVLSPVLVGLNRHNPSNGP